MTSDAVVAMANEIADSGVVLPGAGGEAGTAACFAGQWTERRRSSAVPVAGFRIYEFGSLRVLINQAAPHLSFPNPASRLTAENFFIHRVFD